MSELRKKENNKKSNVGKNEKKKVKDSKKVTKTEGKNNKVEKKSLWVRFRIFCHVVKSEFNKVHWSDREKMIKYSIATIVFIIFCSLFFYLIDIIFALIQSLF